ncbi:MAG: discoidin domain-containing protein, partial [Ignavibacteria bacterium]|nr:discoidin domain-containing protein [Ignavibacteria bacterium]
TASSVLENSIANTPDIAVDGNFFTSWTSENVEPQWIQIDLGKSFNISKIVVFWGTSFAKTYRIGVSNDLLNWTVLKTSTTGAGGYEELTNLTVKGRYFKMFCDKKGTSAYFSVNEIEIYGTPVSTDVVKEKLPAEFSLSQNYPNPFNPSTVISYKLPKAEHVSLIVYDALGREIARLVDEYKPAGIYSIQFNAGQFERSRELSSGIYFYKLTAGSFVQTKKMILIR